MNPKNVTIGSGIDQNKKLPDFLPIGQKIFILHENLEFLMAKKHFLRHFVSHLGANSIQRTHNH